MSQFRFSAGPWNVHEGADAFGPVARQVKGILDEHGMAAESCCGWLGKAPWNDQNGLKYDQDKAFGVENLRQAFNQVRALVESGYGKNGEYVGLDVKAMRTQKLEDSYRHLKNSLEIFKIQPVPLDEPANKHSPTPQHPLQ